jgi:hypothetical protein
LSSLCTYADELDPGNGLRFISPGNPSLCLGPPVGLKALEPQLDGPIIGDLLGTLHAHAAFADIQNEAAGILAHLNGSKQHGTPRKSAALWWKMGIFGRMKGGIHCGCAKTCSTGLCPRFGRKSIAFSLLATFDGSSRTGEPKEAGTPLIHFAGLAGNYERPRPAVPWCAMPDPAPRETRVNFPARS